MSIQICTLVKQDQKYFDDWYNHHIKKGFGPITVYLDDPAKKDAYIRDSVIIKEVIRGGNSSHVFTLNDFLNENKDEKGWCLFIDIDEYADFHADDILKEITKTKIGQGIRIPTMPYIADTEKYREKFIDKPVAVRFPKQSIAVRFMHHKMLMPFGGDLLFSPHSSKKAPYVTYKFMIKHYFTKSREEWDLRRYGVGCVGADNYTDEMFLQCNELV